MREISLTKGKVALVDDDDYGKVCKYKWWTLNEEDAARAYDKKIVEIFESIGEVDKILINKCLNFPDVLFNII